MLEIKYGNDNSVAWSVGVVGSLGLGDNEDVPRSAVAEFKGRKEGIEI